MSDSITDDRLRLFIKYPTSVEAQNSIVSVCRELLERRAMDATRDTTPPPPLELEAVSLFPGIDVDEEE